jgi:hypothetical protein
MVRLVGFFRALRKGSFKGDVGAEKVWNESSPLEVAGRGTRAGPILKDSFFTFLAGLPGVAGIGYSNTGVCREGSTTSVCLSWFDGGIVEEKCDMGGFEEADSGEDAGEGSVKMGDE